MSIGSFLATAGRVGQGIRAEQASMRADRQQQLALEELNRQDEFRRQQLTAPTPELPAQGLMLGAPMRVVEPEFTPAGQTALAGLAAVPAVAGVAPAPTQAVRKPTTGKTPRFLQIEGVTIQPWDMKRPDRLNAGVAGFERIDPNASDNQQAAIRAKNERKLAGVLGSLSAGTDVWFSSFRKAAAPQDQKRALELSDAASSWYQTSDAKDYFRRNPEMLAVAQKNPVNFYNALVENNQRVAKAVAAPTAAPTAPTAPTASTATPTGPFAGIIAQIGAAETGAVANPYQTPNLAGASSAYGKYQFTRDTWISAYRRENPNTGLSNDKIWARRTDPELQERLMARLTQDNANTLTGAGIPVNAPTAYLAHFLGAKTAIKLLQSDRNAPVESVISKKQVDANPTVLKGKTVGQVAEWAVGKTSGGGQPAGTQMAAGVNTGTTPVAAPVRVDPSNFYLADQNMISQDMRVALQNRTELARMAQMYRNAGMGDQFTQTRLKMLDLDNSLLFLQGMQGIQEIAMANDPRRLAAVWSQYAGVPVQLQPQTDGSYNVVVNGRVTQRGVPANTIIDSARSAFDAEYRKMRTESSSSMAVEQFKSQLRISEDAAKAVLQTAREAQNELIKGENARAVELIKQMDPNGKITMLPDGSGRSILQVQGQTVMLDPGGDPIEGSPDQMTAPSASPIAGLAARSVGVGVGG
jgi:hypothetical protein